MNNKYVSALVISLLGFGSSAFAHDYVESCKTVRVPVYDTNATDDALAGALIGGVLGKAITKKDQGAAAGAIVGGIIGAEQSKKKVVGYKNEKKCENVKLRAHAHKQTNWVNPDSGSINIKNSSGKIETKEEVRQRKRTQATQEALNYFGFNVGKADGISGPKTREGIKSYQEFIGLKPTGELLLSDIVVLADCEESSKSANETALADRLKTLQYCASVEYSSTDNDLSPMENTNIGDQQKQLTYLGLIRENHINSKKDLSLNRSRVDALNNIIRSYEYNGPMLDLPKKVNMDYFTETPIELSYYKSVNPKTGQKASDRMLASSVLDSSNNLYFDVKFLEGDSNWSVVSLRLDGLDSGETKKFVTAVNTAMEWSYEAQKRKIKQDITRFIECVPDCSNMDDQGVYNRITFEVNKMGDTYVKISQSDSNFVLIGIDNAVALASYMDYISKVHKFSSESTLSDNEIDKIFK